MRRPHNQKPIKISPESPLSGQQGQFALAVLGFVNRNSTARQTPTAHLRTSRNRAMKTRALAMSALAHCESQTSSAFKHSSRALVPWRVPPGHSRNQNRTEGGVAARAVKMGRLASRADLHRPLARAREPQAEPNGPSARLVLVHARASACQGGVHAKKTAHSRTRALAHRALAHLKIQTTTHPESPPRRAGRAVVPVVWVSRAVHEPTQRGEEHRTNGGVAVWAVQTGSSQCELTQWPLAEARKAKEKPGCL